MSAGRISAGLRAEVRDRARSLCDYCRVHEDDVGAPHEPYHIVTEQHGGQTTAENLAYSCYHCNRYKEVRTSPPLILNPGSPFSSSSLDGTRGRNISGLRAASSLG